jgi:putative tryptophan/tyrosine transport system substrate-binding protein
MMQHDTMQRMRFPGAVRRRDLFKMATGLVATPPVLWAGTGRAQGAMPVIGVLGTTSLKEWGKYVAALEEGLKEAGFVNGRNVTIEYRWAEGHYDRLKAMAADLVARHPDVIVSIAPPSTAVAKAATATIPIVFFLGSDPVKLGYVASLNRPAGNMTGVTMLANSLGVKRLQLMREVVHKPAVFGMLVNPTNENAVPDTRDVSKAATAIGQPLVIAYARSDTDLDAAFAEFARQGAAAAIINPDPFLLGRREKIVALAMQNKLATIFHLPEPVEAGGLMSYGASFVEGHHTVGVYAGRILKGQKPADLPIPQPTKFELSINLKTARALDLDIPPTLLATADEVIE